MRGQTQKDKILALLQTEERVSQPRMRNVGEGYRDCIADLRSQGYEIQCTITLEGTYYTLLNGGKHVEPNQLTSLQAA